MGREDKEKRRSARVKVMLNGNIVFDKKMEFYPYFFIEDLSVNGLMLTIEAQLPLNTLLALELFLKRGKKPIECKGQVKWVNKRDTSGPCFYHTGVEFIDINASAKKSISEVAGGFTAKGQEGATA